MKKVNISVTATRTDIDNQFKGVITFKDTEGTEGTEVQYDYLCTNPQNAEVDILYSWENGKFHINGLPNKELIESLQDKEKCIFALSLTLVSDVIKNTSHMLSHNTTQLMRIFNGDMSGNADRNFEIDEKAYNYIFR